MSPETSVSGWTLLLLYSGQITKTSCLSRASSLELSHFPLLPATRRNPLTSSHLLEVTSHLENSRSLQLMSLQFYSPWPPPASAICWATPYVTRFPGVKNSYSRETNITLFNIWPTLSAIPHSKGVPFSECYLDCSLSTKHSFTHPMCLCAWYLIPHIRIGAHSFLSFSLHIHTNLAVFPANFNPLPWRFTHLSVLFIAYMRWGVSSISAGLETSRIWVCPPSFLCFNFDHRLLFLISRQFFCCCPSGVIIVQHIPSFHWVAGRWSWC